MTVHVEPPPVEIAAPPELVREVVLDFPSYSSWHKDQFKSIAVQGNKAPKDLKQGDKLSVALAAGMSFSPAILENSSDRLKWRGSLPLIFTGDHAFEFRPSKSNPGGTTLVQYEDFSGLLSFTMKTEKKSGHDNHKGFTAFNEDVKKEAERRKASS